MFQQYDLYKTHDLPTPHDCVIQTISQGRDCFIFEFEDDITRHESAKYYCHKAKSLIVRYYPVDMEYSLYQKKIRKRNGAFSTCYTMMQDDALFHLTEHKYRLEYLYHYIAFGSLILVLWAGGEFRVEFPEIQRVEYDWVE